MPRWHKSKVSRGTVALRLGKNAGTYRVGPRPGLDVSEKRITFTPSEIRTPYRLARRLLITQPLFHYQKYKFYYQILLFTN